MRRLVIAAAMVLMLATMAMGQVLANPSQGRKPQGSNAKSAKPQPPDTKPAQLAAGSWMRLLDEGKYGDSWDVAANVFRDRVTKENWEKNIKAVREPLGRTVSRKLDATQYTRTVPGAPDGEYVVMRLDSSFANKKDATETVIAMKDKDGEWRVSGYFIK